MTKYCLRFEFPDPPQTKMNNNDTGLPHHPRDGKKIPISNPYLLCKSNETTTVSGQSSCHVKDDNSKTQCPVQTATAPASVQDQGDATPEKACDNHKQKPENDGMHILLSLQRNYEMLQKNTVKSCLRSKSFPCPEVSTLLQHNPAFDFEVIQAAYQLLLQHPECFGSQTTKSSVDGEQSSLWYMTRLGTAIRFLQFLLISKLDPQKSSPIILGLLKVLTTTLNESLLLWEKVNPTNIEHGDLFNGEISHSYHALQIGCFCLAFLLRIRSVVREHRPDLLAPYWKFLGTLAEAMSPHLPLELLAEALKALSSYLKEFLPSLLPALLPKPQNDNPTKQNVPSLHPQQLKLFIFYLARFNDFLELASNSTTELEQDLTITALTVLIFCRGFPVAVRALRRPDDDIKKLLDSFQKIAHKAEKGLSFVLFKCVNQDECTKTETVLSRASFDLLLGLEHTSEKPIPTIFPNSDAKQLWKSSFYVGKVQTLECVVRRCLDHQHNTVETSKSGFWIEESNVNGLLAVCENLLFDGLPMCFGLFVTGCFEGCDGNDNSLFQILEDCIRSISGVLFQCCTGAPCITSNADRGPACPHHLLLRWLMPTIADSKRNLPTKHHPLTRECVLEIVHFHVIRLYNDDTEDVSSPELGRKFLALVVKVFFDPRTCTSHRAIIACFLRKMLASPLLSASKELRHLISIEYSAKRPNNGKRRSRKRSRKRNCLDRPLFCFNAFTFEDIRLIGSVLSDIPLTIIPNAAADVESFCLEFLPQPNRSGTPPKRLKRLEVKMAILVLAFLEGTCQQPHLRDGGDGVKSLSGGIELIDVQHTIVSWFLSVLNLIYEDGRRQHVEQKDKETILCLGRALFRLVLSSRDQIVSLLAQKSRETSVEQINAMFNVLDFCTKFIQEIPLIRMSAAEGPSRKNDKLVPTPNSDLGIMTVNLVLDAAAALGVMKAFPLEKADGVFQGLVGIFQRLLHADVCWSLHAHTIPSLIRLSMSFAQAHGHLLQNCIPERQRQGLNKLVQGRLKGTVYRYGKHNQSPMPNSNSVRVFTCMRSLLVHCANELEFSVATAARPMQALLPCNSESGIPTTSSLSIPLGSYFLSMPTRDGRKAIVIFPPHESSLEDIRYMWGGDHDSDENAGHADNTVPGVQQLTRVVLSQAGDCRVILKS